MKKRFIHIIIVCLMLLVLFTGCGCNKANTIKDNIQKEANNFSVYRKMIFINLNSDKILYSVEGVFSVQTTYSNEYQGQQEIGIVIQVAPKEYTMHYFSIDNNVCYVIEQIKNTNTDPYHWEIIWYLPLPESKLA